MILAFQNMKNMQYMRKYGIHMDSFAPLVEPEANTNSLKFRQRFWKAWNTACAPASIIAYGFLD
jgi:hypothetical protein